MRTDLRADRLRAGRLIATVLAGSWRASPPPLTLSPSEIGDAIDVLLGSLAAPLAWWRLRHLASAPPGADELREVVRYHALQTELRGVKLLDALAALRRAAIEPVAIKGWSLARLYPDTALRPYGDVDLCVRADQLARAESTVEPLQDGESAIDLVHSEIGELDRRGWEEFLERTQLVPLDGALVRLLCDEDQLRVAAIHALKHGLWNPVWLCDIAIAVESAGGDFDWDRCFGATQPQAQWIGCAIGLARELLGARLPPAVVHRLPTLPRWLVPAVLRVWSDAGAGKRLTAGNLEPIASYWNRPQQLPHAIRERWPTPISAAIVRRAALTTGPQFAGQLAALLAPRRFVAWAKRERKLHARDSAIQRSRHRPQ